MQQRGTTNDKRSVLYLNETIEITIISHQKHAFDNIAPNNRKETKQNDGKTVTFTKYNWQ